MNRTFQVSLALLAALVLLAPLASAHPRALVTEVGERCYLYTNDASEVPEFWIETNGITTGGTDSGTPADHYLGIKGGGSGLQRAGTNPDTEVSAEEWVLRCLNPL